MGYPAEVIAGGGWRVAERLHYARVDAAWAFGIEV